MLSPPSDPANRLARLGRRLRWLPAALFVAAVPVFLVTGSIAWAFNNIGLYESGFERYRIAYVSGIAPADLRQVALDIRAYFNSGEEPLAVRTRIFGTERALFNEREIIHMADVKRLLWGVYGAFGGLGGVPCGADRGGVRPRRTPLAAVAGPPDAVGRRVDRGAAAAVRADCRGGVRRAVSAVPPDQFRQRFLAAGPAHRLFSAAVSAGFLV